MSGVTPEATTAGLAAEVPKENGPATNGPGAYTISSAAPDSTTAQLAKDVPIEGKQPAPPGTFPETPSQDFSVNPLPASAGVGNPIHLQPGEKVPDPGSFTNNTVNSTVSTDQAGYERDASDPGMKAAAAAAASSSAPPEQNGGEVHILPITVPNPANGGSPAIQSVAPDSTTTALAAAVPLEKKAPKSADSVPSVVKNSIEKSQRDPEAAGSEEAVHEKKVVERELLDEVPPKNDAGTPAPVVAAETSATAPAPTEPVPQPRGDGGDISPKTQEPAAAVAAAPAPEQPPVTTRPEPAAPAKSGPAGDAAAPTDGTPEPVKGKKKKNRVSGFFSKLKEKLK